MGLVSYRLGELIQIEDERNTAGKYTLDDVRGISIQKIFIDTKADMAGVSLSPYIIVRPGAFAYVPITSRNGGKITIARNDTDDTYIVSTSYIVFSVKRDDILIPEYLFMYFSRSEFDRYARFNSWGSAREAFSWEDMCSVNIPVPPMDIQRKYVRVYEAMTENQRALSRGLDDLRLVCDMFIDRLKNTKPGIAIGTFIQQTDFKNIDNKNFPFKGLSMDNYFIDSIADDTGLDFSAYKIVRPGDFGCVLMKVGRDCKLTIAYNTSDSNYLISPAYYSFSLKGINPSYFMICVSRPEFERHAWFMCDTSTRGSLSWHEFCKMEIPCANEEEQQIIANIYTAYQTRKSISERLKAKIKSICPVLIKGASDEAQKEITS